MIVLYIIVFLILLLFSAFFSSAETSLLSMDRIKLNHRAKKKNRKALLLTRILADPDEFFSTILIGNNFVNIAAASISTILFSRLIVSDERLILLASTVVTTVIILIFAEVIPKSYAFRYHERLSYFYAYPIKFFTYFFYPFVKVLSFLSSLIFRKKISPPEKKELTPEEIKHFLSSEIKLFHYNPDALRMVNEIIDIAGKDIKGIMTPRMHIIALQEDAELAELSKIILEKKVAKIPIYKWNLDNITGIIHTRNLTAALLSKDCKKLRLKDIASEPIFLSEYSSLHYALKEFKRHNLNMAVILDEYGTTIGILTLQDIFREILGEIRIREKAIKKIDKNTYMIKGSIPVEELSSQLNIDLPEKKDYTTVSGMFIYHYGKFPRVNSKLKIKDYLFVVKRMGKRKIDDIQLILEDRGHK